MTRELARPPTTPRRRELWLSHLWGHTVTETMRNYVREHLPKEVNDESRRVAYQAVEDAIYALMMLVDGVVGAPRSDEHYVEIRTTIELRRKSDHAVEQSVEIGPNGEGMCMGVHAWREGDYGEDPLFEDSDE